MYRYFIKITMNHKYMIVIKCNSYLAKHYTKTVMEYTNKKRVMSNDLIIAPEQTMYEILIFSSWQVRGV